MRQQTVQYRLMSLTIRTVPSGASARTGAHLSLSPRCRATWPRRCFVAIGAKMCLACSCVRDTPGYAVTLRIILTPTDDNLSKDCSERQNLQAGISLLIQASDLKQREAMLRSLTLATRPFEPPQLRPPHLQLVLSPPPVPSNRRCETPSKHWPRPAPWAPPRQAGPNVVETAVGKSTSRQRRLLAQPHQLADRFVGRPHRHAFAR